MTQTYARVFLIGRLGADPDLRFPEPASEGEEPHGAWARLRVATDRPGPKDAQPETDWHTVICRDRLAAFAGRYLTKGRLVFVSGGLVQRSWREGGARRQATEVVAQELLALDARPAAQAGEARQEP